MNEQVEVMQRCPKFNFCKAPVCPLDLNKAMCKRLKGEDVCKLSKSKRLDIGKQLPWRGLTSKELAGENTWKARDENSKHETLEKLANIAPFYKFGSRKKRQSYKVDISMF